MILGPLLTILLIVLIILKLAGVLAVGWGIVLIPLWVFLALVALIFLRMAAAIR